MYSLLTTLPPLFPYDIVEMSYLRFAYILTYPRPLSTSDIVDEWSPTKMHVREFLYPSSDFKYVCNDAE